MDGHVARGRSVGGVFFLSVFQEEIKAVQTGVYGLFSLFAWWVDERCKVQRRSQRELEKKCRSFTTVFPCLERDLGHHGGHSWRLVFNVMVRVSHRMNERSSTLACRLMCCVLRCSPRQLQHTPCFWRTWATLVYTAMHALRYRSK